jgi:hypothetical protein
MHGHTNIKKERSRYYVEQIVSIYNTFFVLYVVEKSDHKFCKSTTSRVSCKITVYHELEKFWMTGLALDRRRYENFTFWLKRHAGGFKDLELWV